MRGKRVLSVGVVLSLLLVALGAAPPTTADAAWVNAAGTQFQVGGQLTAITPNNTGTAFTDPACGAEGGTSLAVVQGLKLAGVDPLLYPVALVVSCLDSSVAANRARLNFINPASGQVIKQLSTTLVPPTGWAQLVQRPDKGDLLGCGSDGSLFSIDYSQTTTTVDGTATPLTSPSGVASCTGLTWDADANVIYVGISVSTTYSIVRFQDGATTLLGSFTAPCATNGLAISGGVLLVSCQGSLTIERVDKSTGLSLGAFPTLTATGVADLGEGDPGLGGFACDPATYHKDATGRDLYTDALWSRRGIDGNGVVALEFPAYTCGMPPSSVVLQGTVPYSPLAAGLAAPASGQAGAVPRAGCFDANGLVIDLDGDGLPDCWETSGIDFDGDGTVDLQLCVKVNTNGDGVTLTTECASPTHKDLFVEIDYMQNHKPDPLALSQTQSVASAGVKSVREAFNAAPVTNPDGTGGIRLHMQVDEQVTFTPLSGPPTSHVNQVAFTPCTGPAVNALDPTQAVDFDTVKAANFGTATERLNLKTLNAKRLAFRYVLFAHNLVGNPSGGNNGSGCSEIGGDDGVVSLGSFATTTVSSVSHARGTTDQQAGTFMHEFGHLLGFGHGGSDNVNCKPNYRSVMSYSRQFAGSPIPNRRLDYSRSADPVLADINKTGFLDKSNLSEGIALGTDPSRGPIPPYFPQADIIVFGPNAWSIATATAASIDWNRSKTTNTGGVSANINSGATSGCDGSGGNILEGQDDWSSVLYRPSAAINFAGGVTPSAEMTSDDEEAFYSARDADANGVGDNFDCGGHVLANGTSAFPCTHRLDVPKGIKPTGNFEIVIFSERNGLLVWYAPLQVLQDSTLTVSLESVVIPVKTKGNGTCAAKDMPDPTTGKRDGIKDLHCQVHVTGTPLPTGTVFATVSGFFFDPLTFQLRAFSAREEVTIAP